LTISVRDRPLLWALGAALLAAMPASAQDAGAPVGPTAPTGQPAGVPAPGTTAGVAPQSADSGGIADIVVTARRRNESIQSTPIAITAITPQTLESKATLNIGDLQGQVPNLLITPQASGAATANIAIRGLAFADVEKSFEPTVGIVVDGVFIGTSTGQYLDFFDVSSVEVLRGPQGTLYGRNTIGGVINLRRTRPTGEWGARLEGSYGSYDTWAARGVFNAPIIPGKLAVKGFYFRSESAGFYRNAFTRKLQGASENDNFGLTFLATPTENVEALITVEKQVQDFVPVDSNISKTGELFCNFEPANECNRNSTTDLYTVFSSAASHGHYSAPAITGEINWNIAGVKLTSITSYRESHENQMNDVDGSSADLFSFHRIQRFHQTSQELRAAGKIVPTLDYVVGAYYYDSYYNLNQTTRIFGMDLPVAQVVFGTNTSYAGFADFDWQFLPHFRLNVGGRYTHDEKTINNTFGAFLGAPSANFNKFTPKVVLDYRPNDNFLFYASWSRGYRSGGFSNRASTVISTNKAYGPETVDSYELGAKTALFDRKRLFNVAAFYADYKNLQQNTTVPGGPTGNETLVTNVGSAAIKGVELDMTARPVRRLTATAGLGYLDSRFKNFITGGTDPTTGTPATFDYSDVNLIYNPSVTGNLNATYTMPAKFGEVLLNFGYRFIAPYDQQISIGPFNRVVSPAGVTTITVLGNDPRVRSPEQSLVDAAATLQFNYRGKKAKVTVYGRNLTDDRGPASAFTVAGLFSFATAREPRTFGVQLGVDF